jgi:hypothetical protein
MGFNVTFYETKYQRLLQMLNLLNQEQPTPQLMRKIRSIECVPVNPQPKLRISNLTYNYSTTECKAYWYGRSDYHGKRERNDASCN